MSACPRRPPVGVLVVLLLGVVLASFNVGMTAVKTGFDYYVGSFMDGSDLGGMLGETDSTAGAPGSPRPLRHVTEAVKRDRSTALLWLILQCLCISLAALWFRCVWVDIAVAQLCCISLLFLAALECWPGFSAAAAICLLSSALAAPGVIREVNRPRPARSPAAGAPGPFATPV
jgi:hypothetical protein